MIKHFTACLLLLGCCCGCVAGQENPSAAASPSASATPVVQTSESSEMPAARRVPAVDPELAAGSFTPGAAGTYSNVYIKGRYLAMTFDDGPSSEYTPTLLDELARRKIHATFFLIGQNVVQYPAIVRRIVAEGHEVGNHSWTHPELSKMSDAAVTSQIEKTQQAIVDACGVTPTLLRPPYGAITRRQKTWINDTFHLKVILWSVDPLDWKKPGESVVRSRIVGGAEDGAIILAHDIHGSTVHAMPATFDQLAAKGFQFVTVSELLAMEAPKPLKTLVHAAGNGVAAAVSPEPIPGAGVVPLPTPMPLPSP